MPLGDLFTSLPTIHTCRSRADAKRRYPSVHGRRRVTRTTGARGYCSADLATPGRWRDSNSAAPWVRVCRSPGHTDGRARPALPMPLKRSCGTPVVVPAAGLGRDVEDRADCFRPRAQLEEPSTSKPLAWRSCIIYPGKRGHKRAVRPYSGRSSGDLRSLRRAPLFRRGNGCLRGRRRRPGGDLPLTITRNQVLGHHVHEAEELDGDREDEGRVLLG